MFLTPSDSGNTTVNKEQRNLALKEIEVLHKQVHGEEAINVITDLSNKMAKNKKGGF